MSQIFNYTGKDYYHGGAIYSDPKETGLFLSLGNQVDVYYPHKRARVNGSFVMNGSIFEHKKQPSIDVLPDECLYEIFRRFPVHQERSSCACVSKRWLNLLSTIPNEVKPQIENDGFLTRSLDGKKATDVRLSALAVGTEGHGGLGKLMIKGTNSTRGVTNLGLKAVARCCSSLKVLSLWNVPLVGDEGLIDIAKGCPRLEKLDLCECPLVTDKALIAIAKGCPNLTAVSLDGCVNVGNEGLQAIGKFCVNLKSITIKGCPNVGHHGIASMMSSSKQAFTKVKLHGLNVSDVSLAVIGHYGKVITNLALSNLPNINERGFWVMGNAHGLQHLKSLTINSCQGVTDVALEAVAKGCPNLKQFILKKCAFFSDNGLVSFSKAASLLESLQLDECHRITQIGFFGLLLNRGSKLRSLTMSSCFGFREKVLGLPLPNSSFSLRSVKIQNCPGFGDMSLAMMANLCPKLQYIHLNGLPGITDASLLSVISSCEAGDGFVNVSLSGCINVTDNVVVALAKTHGSTLEVLNLEGCGKVTDASLAAISDDCLLLNELDVSRCAITDLGVLSLARSKPLSLRVLSLSGCSVISDKCLPFLAKIGQSLVGLNLQHCNSISNKVVDMLGDRLFKCDILS